MQIIYLSKFIPSFWFLTSLLYLFLFILITNIHLYYLFQIITHTLTMWIIQPRRASLVGYNKVSIVLYQMLSFSKKLKVFFTMLITENIETLYYSHFFRKRLVRFAKKITNTASFIYSYDIKKELLLTLRILTFIGNG